MRAIAHPRTWGLALGHAGWWAVAFVLLHAGSAHAALPIADAGGPYAAMAGEVVVLDASGSELSACASVRYGWDCDEDGVIDGSYSTSPTYDWSTAGVDGPVSRTITAMLRCEIAVGSTSYFVDLSDTAVVDIANAPPVILRVDAPELPLEGTDIELAVVFQDPEAADLHTIDWLLSDGQGASEAAPTFRLGGEESLTVEVTVADDDGGADVATATVDVENAPPTITGSPATAVTVHDAYTFAPVGADPGGDTLTWGLSAVPDGATFEPATGALTWIPSGEQVGAWPFRLSVDDGDGGRSYLEWTVEVISAEENPGAQPIERDEGQDGDLPGAPSDDTRGDVVMCGATPGGSAAGALLALGLLRGRRRASGR